MKHPIQLTQERTLEVHLGQEQGQLLELAQALLLEQTPELELAQEQGPPLARQSVNKQINKEGCSESNLLLF